MPEKESGNVEFRHWEKILVHITAEVKKFLEKPLISTLATIDELGAPRTRAIWHDWSSEQGLLLFTHTSSTKWQHILRDPRVSLCVDDSETPYRSVTVDGHVEPVTNQSSLLFPAVLHMSRKYYGCIEGTKFAETYKDTADSKVVLFRITIDRITVQGL